MPKEHSKHFVQKGYIPIRGTINNVDFIGKLAPRKPDRHVLYLNHEIRRKTGVKEGDMVTASIEYDPVSRDISIPDDVELILRENNPNWQYFLNLSPSRRNEILAYIIEAKRPETRLNRIMRIIERLKEKSLSK